MVKQVTSDNFESLVLQADRPVLVKFGADWCGPCRQMHSILEGLSADERWLVCEVNTDRSRQLARQYGIHALPTLVFFKEGREVERSVGVRSHYALERVLEELLRRTEGPVSLLPD